jgi:hypothetical protein
VFFKPTQLQENAGYAAWISLPLIGWIAWMDDEGKIYWL